MRIDEAQGRGAEGSRWESNCPARPFLLQDLMEEDEKRGDSAGACIRRARGGGWLCACAKEVGNRGDLFFSFTGYPLFPHGLRISKTDVQSI